MGKAKEFFESDGFVMSDGAVLNPDGSETQYYELETMLRFAEHYNRYIKSKGDDIMHCKGCKDFSLLNLLIMWKLHRTYFKSRWADRKYFRDKNWTIMGISQKWLGCDSVSLRLCLFGFEIRFWFKR